MAEQGWLPDVNVWVALASNKHEHHSAAGLWFDSVKDQICFCRVTQMGLLRLLTNLHVMEEDVLRPAGALRVYANFLSDSRICFVGEPGGIERLWNSFMSNPSVGGSSWTDAYLAAFAIQSGLRIVCFDGEMKRWDGLTAEVLKA